MDEEYIVINHLDSKCDLLTVHRENEELKRKIADVSAELAASTQAFDKYRERARTSLRKSAAEQQAAEKRIGEALEVVRVSTCAVQYPTFFTDMNGFAVFRLH